MRLKLLRRSQIIDAIRKAYLEDVVVVKNELMRKSAMTEEVQWVHDIVPSKDPGKLVGAHDGKRTT